MAIQAKPLPNKEVKAAKATDKELSLHDGGGLLLFVKPSGTKTWRFRYYHPQTKSGLRSPLAVIQRSLWPTPAKCAKQPKHF